MSTKLWEPGTLLSPNTKRWQSPIFGEIIEHVRSWPSLERLLLDEKIRYTGDVIVPPGTVVMLINYHVRFKSLDSESQIICILHNDRLCWAYEKDFTAVNY